MQESTAAITKPRQLSSTIAKLCTWRAYVLLALSPPLHTASDKCWECRPGKKVSVHVYMTSWVAFCVQKWRYCCSRMLVTSLLLRQWQWCHALLCCSIYTDWELCKVPCSYTHVCHWLNLFRLIPQSRASLSSWPLLPGQRACSQTPAQSQDRGERPPAVAPPGRVEDN